MVPTSTSRRPASLPAYHREPAAPADLVAAVRKAANSLVDQWLSGPDSARVSVRGVEPVAADIVKGVSFSTYVSDISSASTRGSLPPAPVSSLKQDTEPSQPTPGVRPATASETFVFRLDDDAGGDGESPDYQADLLEKVPEGLAPSASPENRIHALNLLAQFSAEDIVSSERWTDIVHGLSCAIDPEEHADIFLLTLKLMGRLYQQAPLRGGEVFMAAMSAAKAMLSKQSVDTLLHSIVSASVDDKKSTDQRAYLYSTSPVAKLMRLISYMLKDLPIHWVFFPTDMFNHVIETTCSVLAPPYITDDRPSPGMLMLSLVSPANPHWFSLWARSSFSYEVLLISFAV